MMIGGALTDAFFVNVPYGAEERLIFLDGRGGGDSLFVDYRVPDDRRDEIYNGVVLLGGSGSDAIFGRNVAGRVDAGSGSDRIDWYYGSGVLDAGPGDDFVYRIGFDEPITIRMGAGRDGVRIMQTGGDAFVDLGDGNDFVSFSAGGGTVLGGAGNDRINIEDQTDGVTVDGGVGADDIRVYGTGRAIVNGGAGDDRIFTFASQGEIDAGSGLDDVRVIAGDHVVTLGGAPDRLTFLTGFVEVTDFRTGNSGDQLILRDVFDVYRPVPNTPQSLIVEGYIRFVQDGADTMVQGDRDAGGDQFGWTDLVRLNNVRLDNLNAHNLDGLLI